MLYISLLYKKYLREGINALDKDYKILVIRESFKILKYIIFILIIGAAGVIFFIKRILFININYLYKNYI